ncbi:MAG: SDR family oxidoreductase [Muribaculaceae bacterium]|nr:SDR family oxidoreductase [Muribaculaceae bacterium]
MFNPFSLQDKTILVVGASSGMGRETALECSKMGAKLIVTSRNEEKLKELISEMDGEGHSVIVADITKQEDIDNLVKTIPVIDGLVVSSGIAFTSPISFCSREKFDNVFNLNFFAYAELVRLLYKKKKINKGGSIVLFGSVAGGFNVGIGSMVYGTAKSALNSFVKYAALEFATKKIRVNSVNPGMVNTPMTAGTTYTQEELEKDMKENYPLQRYGEVEDIAPAVIYLLSDASSWMTGQTLVLDGGLSIK